MPTPPSGPLTTIGPPQVTASNNVPLLALPGGPDFVNNLPPVGAGYALTQTVLAVTPTSVTAYNPFTNGQSVGAGITYKGTVGSVRQFQLGVDTLPIPNSQTLPADGTKVTFTGGASAALALESLNYTLVGLWAFSPGPGATTNYVGMGVGGYQTPNAAVPASGTATYIGSGGNVGAANAGGVVGSVFVSSSNGSINTGTLEGQASMSVNFSTSQVTGTLTNMTVTPAGSSSSTAWNNVTLTGTLSAGTTSPSLSGSTSTGGAASDVYALTMSSVAAGKFTGALYGPGGQEVGAVWSLYEQTGVGGKSAVGVIAATKQ